MILINNLILQIISVFISKEEYFHKDITKDKILDIIKDEKEVFETFNKLSPKEQNEIAFLIEALNDKE